MFTESLAKLGFNENEIKVYLSLLEMGSANAQAISRACGMPRSSVYGFLESLIQRGVVEEEYKGKIKNFTVAPPQALTQMLETEKIAIGKKEVVAEKLMEELSSFMNKTQHDVPKLLRLEGKKNVENMLYEYAPLWQRSCERTNNFTLWGYQDHFIVEQYRDWQNYIWEFRDPRFDICLFSNKEGVKQQNQEKIPNRQIRDLPEGLKFENTIWIRGEYVIYIRSREKPHSAVMLYDPVLAASQRAIFEVLWKVSEKEAEETLSDMVAANDNGCDNGNIEKLASAGF